MRVKADLLLLIVTIIWGSAFAVMRFAAGFGTVFYLNGTRFLLGGLVVLPFARVKGAFNRTNWYYPLLSGLALFAAIGFQQAGLATTTAGNSGFLTSLYIVIVPFILWIVWRVRPTRLLILALVIALAGAYLLSTAGRFTVHIGDVLNFIGSFFWAMQVVVVSRVQGKMRTLPFSFAQLAICGLLNLAIAPFIEHPTTATMTRLLPAILYTGIFSVGLAFTLQVVAQKHTPANDAALIMSLESVFAVIFGWIFLHEALLPIQIGGCALILLAVLIVQLQSWRLNGIEARRGSEMVK